MPEVIKARRAALGLSQADLAAQVGLDKRQIRRYEAGDAQPTLSAGRQIAQALGITLDELAGAHSRRVGLSGAWFAAWETWKDGEPVFTAQPVTLRQRGDLIQIQAENRGNVTVAEGGYLWRGELRLWDNEVLMGWYAADDEGIRSLGTLFFHVHMHGQHMAGRWVGQSHDGPLLTGAASIAKSEEAATTQLRDLLEGSAVK
ncbi:helix-turn-helix domain-containing protein [Nostocoides sp. Soil756]|uniref:helix-turn-helix transcriptional regulator n=1 Tax=Nostocoides sp. Soil756 TaxID=1736399 RepID=UPI000700DE8D|nr:helix-turn-helix domain-containing protein [Tetrasphaera sp. Soil756]KRE63743.1 DNA-binding protein [Tetrasphaera sp. Soil756]